MATAPSDPPRVYLMARDKLTLVRRPAVPDETLAPPPDLSSDDLTDDRDTRTLAPIRDALEIGGSAYPDFIDSERRFDTAWSEQTHWRSDAKGEPFTFRINADLARLISIIVEHAGTPYKTRADFMRDAAYYLAVAVRDLVNINDRRLLQVLEREEVLAAAEYEAKLQEEVVKYTHGVVDALLGALERGALKEACRQINARWNHVQAMPVQYERVLFEQALKESPLVNVIADLGARRGISVPAALLGSPSPSPEEGGS